jgi:NCS2 family nucleobase:cation symporter-2
MIANLSVLLGLVAGTAVAAVAGQTSFAQVGDTPWLGMARPLMFGWPRFALLPALVMCVAMVVVMTETTGNCLAIGEIAGREIGPATLTAAFRADGLSTMLGGFMNSFPYNAYSQNTGLLSLSKMKSRYTVAAGGGLLVGARISAQAGGGDRCHSAAGSGRSFHRDVRHDGHGRH